MICSCNDLECAFVSVPVSGSGSKGEERVEEGKCSLGDPEYLNSECANCLEPIVACPRRDGDCWIVEKVPREMGGGWEEGKGKMIVRSALLMEVAKDGIDGTIAGMVGHKNQRYLISRKARISICIWARP